MLAIIHPMPLILSLNERMKSSGTSWEKDLTIDKKNIMWSDESLIFLKLIGRLFWGEQPQEMQGCDCLQPAVKSAGGAYIYDDVLFSFFLSLSPPSLYMHIHTTACICTLLYTHNRTHTRAHTGCYCCFLLSFYSIKKGRF